MSIVRARLVPPPAANVDAAALARYFRKGYFQSFRRLASGRYMGPIARQLNGRIGLFKALGRHATWYVPTIIGLYNVFDAAPEVRMHTLFEQGFGVLGGYAGTVFGSEVVGLGVVSILGLGPLGAFVAVFLCATAFGLAGNGFFKWFGNRMLDASGRIEDQMYYSIDELIGAYQ